MTMRQSFYACAVLTIIALAVSMVISPSLPAIVATHWNAKGQIDERGPKEMALFLMPGVMMLNLALMFVLPKLSPKKFEITNFGGAYGAIWVSIQAMFLCLHVIFLQGARNEAIDVTRWIMPVMFIFFALMGNWMGKLRQNFYMGIRTPWTLADSAVWDETHRAAGRIWFYGGLLGGLLSAIGLTWWIGLVLFFVMTLYPVYLSWAIYRRRNP